jgi:hypothetical protein
MWNDEIFMMSVKKCWEATGQNESRGDIQEYKRS